MEKNAFGCYFRATFVPTRKAIGYPEQVCRRGILIIFLCLQGHNH